MARDLLRRVLLATAPVALLAAPACHPAYEMPSLGQPQATAKVRVIYHRTPGTQLEHLVLVNNHALPVPLPPFLPGEISRAIPIRLEPALYEVRAAYFHMVTIMQTHAQSYSCGANGATCTRMVTTPVTTRYNDEACSQAAAFSPQRDGVYLLQYDYFGQDRCTLACLREWPQPDGSFRNTPCEPAPAPH
jgi:hypothetical protein